MVKLAIADNSCKQKGSQTVSQGLLTTAVNQSNSQITEKFIAQTDFTIVVSYLL